MLYMIVLLFTVATLLIWEILRQRFVDQLHEEFENIWVNLGRPRGLISRRFVLDDLALEKYIHAKKYKELPSPKLIEKGDILYYVQLTGVLVLAIALLIVFFGP